MKDFLKVINWKKFWKYELIAILIVGVLYLNSLWQGNNIFPENLYVIALIPGLFAFMMILKTVNTYRLQKYNEKLNKNNVL